MLCVCLIHSIHDFLFLSFFRIYDWISISNRHKRCFTFAEAEAFLMFPSGKFAFLTFSFGLGINTLILFSVWAMTYRGRYKFWIGQHCSTTKESLLIGCNVSLYQHNKQMCNLWWRASSNNSLLGDIIVCSIENYCHDAFSVFLHVV